MKQKRLLIFILMVGTILLAGCLGGESADDREPDEALVALASEFMELLNNEQYDEATELFNQTMRDQLTAADLNEIWSDISGEIGSMIDWEFDSSEEKEGYEVIYMNGIFEETDLTFLVTFDDNQEIAGFYIQ